MALCRGRRGKVGGGLPLNLSHWNSIKPVMRRGIRLVRHPYSYIGIQMTDAAGSGVVQLQGSQPFEEKAPCSGPWSGRGEAAADQDEAHPPESER